MPVTNARRLQMQGVHPHKHVLGAAAKKYNQNLNYGSNHFKKGMVCQF
jgi:hypothetical protein